MQNAHNIFKPALLGCTTLCLTKQICVRKAICGMYIVVYGWEGSNKDYFYTQYTHRERNMYDNKKPTKSYGHTLQGSLLGIVVWIRDFSLSFFPSFLKGRVSYGADWL